MFFFFDRGGMTYFEGDFVRGNGAISAHGVSGGHGRRVDFGVGVVRRRRRVQATSAIVHLQPVEHGRAVDQVAGDGAQTVHVAGQQRSQRHLGADTNREEQSQTRH